MGKQLKIFLSGLFAIIPIAITIAVIVWIGGKLDSLGMGVIKWISPIDISWLEKWHGIGILLLIVSIYLVGLMTRFWIFGKLFDLISGVFTHLPGVKTIYESVRDLMKLFDSKSAQEMGQVVEYCPPDSEIGMLGILTNEQPEGTSSETKAAVYFPLAYMIGGPVLFVPRQHLRTVDMPVERALKLCATACVGGKQPETPDKKSK